MNDMLHRFHTDVSAIALPQKFTYPFCYTPHPLCTIAAGEVQEYLSQQPEWQEELSQGKMFGVLVVQTQDGSIGYLAAFSGILAGSNMHPFFVPPVYDLLQPDGFFKQEEAQISALNLRICQLEADESYHHALTCLSVLEQEAARTLDEARRQMKTAKAARDARRAQAPLTPDEENGLIRESQFQKAEYKRLEHAWKEKLAEVRSTVEKHQNTIGQLKDERKTRSAALQQRLFEQFRMLNARGERKDLCTIFAKTAHKVPPAGAGECAAPKLLQQAYLQGWKPLAMAEFWWGASPKTEVRHHGHYYPACKGKCEPILGHMLQGLNVDENPLTQSQLNPQTLETVYEDEWLVVVCKPAGMLSVPGKEQSSSAYALLRQHYPEADGPLIVHRLDMDTSGLLLAAKTKRVHQHLQAQFKNRQIQKEYVALLDGIVAQKEGDIDLPLRPDHLDRPRQVVDTEHGKPAHTHYRVLEYRDGQTRILFQPHTGRTHQLRVHAAHPQGLHCPITGDRLYGQQADRLYLHAETLEFTHPITGQRLHITRKADF